MKRSKVARWLRALAACGAGVIAVLVVALLAAHTSFGRGLAWSWLRHALASYGIEAHASRLEYNLLALDVGVRDVVLNVPGRREAPFFTADLFRVKLRSGLLLGRAAADTVEILAPRVRLVRSADGRSNWPALEGGRNAEPPGPLELGTVRVRNLDVTVADEPAARTLEIASLSLDLPAPGTGRFGTFRLEGTARYREENREVAVRRLGGSVRFDGSNVWLRGFRLETGTDWVQVEGRIGPVADDPRLDLAARGSINLRRLSEWAGIAGEPTGDVAFEASATGVATGPDVALSVAGDGLAWRGLRGLSLQSNAAWTGGTIDVTGLTLGLAGGGELTGSARATLGRDSASGTAAATWRALPLAAVQTAATLKLPFTLSAAMDGRLDARWSDARADRVTLTLENQLRGLPGAGRLAVDGSMSIAVDAGRWRARIRSLAGEAARIEGLAGGRIAADDPNLSTLAGSGTIAMADLAGAARAWRRASGLARAQPDEIAGEANASLALDGTIGSPLVSAVVRGDRIRYGSFGPASLLMAAASGDGRLDVTSIDVRTKGNSAHGSGRMVFESEAIEGRFEAQLDDMSELAAGAPPWLRAAGAGVVTAEVSGTVSAPTVHVAASGAPLASAGQIADRWSVDMRFDPAGLSVDRISLSQPSGELTGSGRYNPADDSYRLKVNGRSLSVQPIARPGGEGPIPLRALLDLEFEGAGTLKDPRGRGRLAASNVEWGGRDIGGVTADVTIARQAIEASARMTDEPVAARATFRVAPFGPYVADAEIADLDLARLAARWLPDAGVTRGTLSAAFRSEGDVTDLPAASVTVDLRRFEGAFQDSGPLRLSSPAQWRYASGQLDVDDTALQIGRTTIRAGGSMGSDPSRALTASLDGSLEDLVFAVPLAATAAGQALPGPVQARGSVHATATARGDPLTPVVDGALQVSDASMQVGAVPAAGEIAIAATFRNNAFELSRLAATWQGARITASGQVPISVLTRKPPAGGASPPTDSPLARLNVSVDSASEALLAPWLDPATLEQIRAQVAGTLTVEAPALSLADARGAIVLDRVQTTIGGVALDQTEPTRVALEGGRVDVLNWKWAGPGNEIIVSGGARIEPRGDVDVRTDGHLDLALLGALVPDVGTTGQARLRVRAHGPLDRPALDGRVEVSAAGIRLTDPRVIVTGLSGTLVLDGDRIVAEGFDGTANGGSLRLSGDFRYGGRATGSLAIAGRGIALDVKGLRTEFDTDLTLAKGNGRPALTGSVTVQRGVYREPLSLTGGLLAALRAQDVAGAASGPSMLETIDLNVRVTSVDDLIVDNNYGQLQLGADVRVVGTPASPGVVGRATVREGGQIFLGGNVYRIDGDGTIDFADPNRITPNLSITAVTRVSGHQVTLTVKGPPESLSAVPSSDEGLGQADLYSLLLTGRTLEQAGGAALAIPPEQVLGYLSGELLGTAGRAVGLDSIRIQRGLPDVQFNAGLVATETDPSARLTFGKDVTPNLQLVFSQSLKETGGLTWIVSYKLRRNIELRAVTFDDGDRSYDFRHAVTFGGPAPAASPAARRRREPVVAVRFSGPAGDTFASLAGRLKLRQGDAFDFFKWQADRDRLEAYFADRGYYEARVSATRQSVVDSEAPGVALEYEIERGPLTSLVVEGFDLPQGVVRDLEAIWQRTAFDQFLVDELTTRARAYLIGRGYLRAALTADITRGEEQKRVLLRIDPGPRTTKKEIQLSGNEVIPTSQLQATIQSRQLSEAAWVEPERLRTALLGLYREEGRLAASVRVRPPIYEGETARLPVEIVEGPEFRIGSIVLDGVAGLGGPAARAALQIEAGDPYSVARIERARQRLEASYRKAGFAEARVTAASDVERDAARVAVSLTVAEGSRHVLSDVVVTGARRTRAPLIARALRLDVGQPVDLAGWYEARSRLYDTGVFRNVDIEEEPVGTAQPDSSGVSEQPVRANVLLEEWPPLRARYGLQVADEQRLATDTRELSPGVSADLTYRNLFGRAISAGLAGRYDADFRAVRAFLTAPALAGRSIVSNLFVSRSREDIGQASARPFVTDKVTLAGEQRIRPKGRLELVYGYNFERNHTFDRQAAPGDPLAFDISVNVARLTGTVLADARDDLVDATRGWFHSTALEYAAAGLGSDVRFAKLVVQQYYYRSLGRVVLASAGRVGLAAGFGQRLIPSERFFAGGGTSVRGFEQDSLGPTDFFGDVTGGNALLVVNQEVRFPVFRWFRGVGFADAGNVFATVRDVSLGDLRPSAGLGTRIQTPVALVRIDFAVPIGRGFGAAGGRWIFSVGQAF